MVAELRVISSAKRRKHEVVEAVADEILGLVGEEMVYLTRNLSLFGFNQKTIFRNVNSKHKYSFDASCWCNAPREKVYY